VAGNKSFTVRGQLLKVIKNVYIQKVLSHHCLAGRKYFKKCVKKRPATIKANFITDEFLQND